MTNTFKYTVGDKVTTVLGWVLMGSQSQPIKGPKATISDCRINKGREEYFLTEFNTWMTTDAILKDEEKSSAIEEKDLNLRPLPPDIVKKAESIDKEPDLPKVTIKGVEVPVIEHFKEIKEYCENHELFRRWYNRGQFLKYILGTFESDGEEDYDADTYGEWGTLLGCLSGENSHCCWCIEIYDASKMTKENLKQAVDETGSYNRGFFLKDKSGAIYFVFTDID